MFLVVIRPQNILPKYFIQPLKILTHFYVCRLSFTETKRFVSSLLCAVFYFSSHAYYSACHGFIRCCPLKYKLKIKKKYFLSPSVRRTTTKTGFISQVSLKILSGENGPSVGVDGQRLVLVLAPMLALADEAAKPWERHVTRIHNDLLMTLALKHQPPATLLQREVTLGMDRRNQVGLVTYGHAQQSTARSHRGFDELNPSSARHEKELGNVVYNNQTGEHSHQRDMHKMCLWSCLWHNLFWRGELTFPQRPLSVKWHTRMKSKLPLPLQKSGYGPETVVFIDMQSRSCAAVL